MDAETLINEQAETLTNVRALRPNSNYTVEKYYEFA